MRTEWKSRRDVFQDIAHHFYVQEIDLFASFLNHQPSLHVSRLLDPSASAVDAFQQDWSQWKSGGATASNSSEREKRQS